MKPQLPATKNQRNSLTGCYIDDAPSDGIVKIKENSTLWFAFFNLINSIFEGLGKFEKIRAMLVYDKETKIIRVISILFSRYLNQIFFARNLRKVLSADFSP